MNEAAHQILWGPLPPYGGSSLVELSEVGRQRNIMGMPYFHGVGLHNELFPSRPLSTLGLYRRDLFLNLLSSPTLPSHYKLSNPKKSPATLVMAPKNPTTPLSAVLDCSSCLPIVSVHMACFACFDREGNDNGGAGRGEAPWMEGHDRTPLNKLEGKVTSK